jgi:hypothetical protein
LPRVGARRVLGSAEWGYDARDSALPTLPGSARSSQPAYLHDVYIMPPPPFPVPTPPAQTPPPTPPAPPSQVLILALQSQNRSLSQLVNDTPPPEKACATASGVLLHQDRGGEIGEHWWALRRVGGQWCDSKDQNKTTHTGRPRKYPKETLYLQNIGEQQR